MIYTIKSKLSSDLDSYAMSQEHLEEGIYLHAETQMHSHMDKENVLGHIKFKRK